MNSVQTLGTTTDVALDNLMLGQLARFQGAVDPQGRFPGDTVTLPVSQPSFAPEQSVPRVGGVLQRRMVDHAAC